MYLINSAGYKMKMCEVVGWFKGRRIIETHGKFIPQFRRWNELRWFSIDNGGMDYWLDVSPFIRQCSCSTFAEANSKFDEYKTHLENMRAKKLAKKIADRVTFHCVK